MVQLNANNGYNIITQCVPIVPQSYYIISVGYMFVLFFHVKNLIANNYDDIN